MFLIILVVLISPVQLNAQKRGEMPPNILYKSTKHGDLYFAVYHPPKALQQEKNPALVLFHGGCYIFGGPGMFERQAVYLSSRGLTVFLVQYRLLRVQRTTPIHAISDGKSAIRYIRAHAKEFSVDPDRIAAGGGSAGGHLAASCALLDMFNDPDDDFKVSCVPDALVLFNPVFKTGPKSEGGYGLPGAPKDHTKISPWHNIRKGAPPTIILNGTKDGLVPVKVVTEYQKMMQDAGSRCDLKLFEGQGHGFFNFKKEGDNKYAVKTMKDVDEFLVSIGYLSGKSTIDQFIFPPKVTPVPHANKIMKKAWKKILRERRKKARKKQRKEAQQ